MVNERKTESIVRDHFKKYESDIHIEEQQSENIKIDKLLKFASKKGVGRGYPEFLITFNTNSDLVLVVECKASITKHESIDRNRYADYAVDGALLYGAYLAKEFDVLIVAISGETTSEVLVSHFLHLRGEQKAVEVFGSKLLSAEDYLNGYLKSPEKFRQDYNGLLDFTKTLNRKLHSHKILESQRSLLISCIMIALDNAAFKCSYSSHTSPKSLALSLVQTVSTELKDASIAVDKLESLSTQFGFITTDTSLSTKPDVLKGIIDVIDENINQFIKTHEYFDVLGQLYIEFLRYANSDKGLGIVLTPPHITELFSELARVNKNSIVYDNCTGTGGFLISAMKKMVEDAKGDNDRINAIKSNSLIGTEYQSHIFALAVSNMYIHQDGKTNIISGSCFDPQIIKAVKDKKPTVGFLNPPYKDEADDPEEIEFILNNLEVLTDGGVCVAIIPISSMIAKSGIKLALKEKILKKHTLEAVLSMPESLFHNSKVSPVSVIAIFTAHKPHQNSKKTWLGYFREDGFVKTKNRGRIDLNGTWEERKKEWLSLYSNRETKENISLTKKLSSSDEWCIEAYLVSDYTRVTESSFTQLVQKYLAFRLLHNLLDFKPKSDFDSYKREQTELVKLSSLFEVYNGLASSAVKVLETPETKSSIRYIRPSQSYEGSVAGFVDSFFVEDKDIYPDYTIYVSTDGQGSHTYSYVSSFEFVPNSNVSVLIPKKQMSLQEKLYYSMCITDNRYKFSYGRKPKGDRLKDILVPSIPASFVYKDAFSSVLNNWKAILN